MDLYGSALWHLQKENELVLLAEEMEESNKMCPQVYNTCTCYLRYLIVFRHFVYCLH